MRKLINKYPTTTILLVFALLVSAGLFIRSRMSADRLMRSASPCPDDMTHPSAEFGEDVDCSQEPVKS